MALKVAIENPSLIQITTSNHEIWIREKDDGKIIVEYEY